MVGNINNEFDPIALWVLLMLSGGQRFTAHELSRLPDRPNGNLWAALQTLLDRQFIKSEKGKFIIATAGIEFLALRGVIAAEPEDEPERKDFIKKIRPPFFSSFNEFFVWIAMPLILLIPAFAFASAATAGYYFISLDKKIAQISIWVLYFAIVILYGWLSHHHVMENERLVIFRGGKAIGKKGPGLVFILPLIDNPKKVDVRERSQEIKKEPCITQDRILANAGFYISWHIDDPTPSLTKVSKVDESMSLLSTAVLRATIAEFTMENAMERRRALNALIRSRIEHKATEWGVEVNNTELRELTPPDGVMKHIENLFTANLESEATLAKYDARVESLRRLYDIGSQIDKRTFLLRYLETLEKVGDGATAKYVIPIEFFQKLEEWIQDDINPDNNGLLNNSSTSGQLPIKQ